ncbi:MAG: ATP-binding protein [Candidatus Rokubacteria bacterium]|nr:ATP-binding protein [Candidatus Rokubacteria bacterium]
MIIIHGVNKILPRILMPIVEEALGQFPVVVVTGARQTGKSTLVQHLPSSGDRLYRSLDDLDLLARAQQHPEALLEEGGRLTLDEVQRAPQLLVAIKRAVDRDRRKGRFLLTGSANLLLMRKISESLAGRAIYLALLPMTEREKRGSPHPGPWGRLVNARSTNELALALARTTPPTMDWPERALIGGYPPVVLADSHRERVRWFEGYVRTYLERDLQEVASISALVDFRRLVGLAVLRLGQIVNQSELARDAALSQPTVHRYLNLLETSYQIVRVPAFARSRSKRLIKSPKLYWGDVGLASFLLGISDPGELRGRADAGAILENLVLAQILAWREVELPRPQLLYWRTTAGVEVDFVIESADRLLPVEVKAASRVRPEDGRSLELFLDEHPKAAPVGLLVHGGRDTFPLTRRILAAPVATLL